MLLDFCQSTYEAGADLTSTVRAAVEALYDAADDDSATGGPDPCVVRGLTRGLHMNGLGAVFTAEVELAATPGGVGLFQTTVGPDQKAKFHKTKLARVPMLQQTMRDMVLSLAASPALKLADNDQVVIAVRLWYQRWEDTTGLPGQIVARLDHKGGTVKMDVQ